MTKKKTIAMIDEKVYNAVGHYTRHTAASSAVAGLMAVIAGAKLNEAQEQEIREQLDGVKWRLVEIEEQQRQLLAPTMAHVNTEINFKGCSVTMQIKAAKAKGRRS